MDQPNFSGEIESEGALFSKKDPTRTPGETSKRARSKETSEDAKKGGQAKNNNEEKKISPREKSRLKKRTREPSCRSEGRREMGRAG